MIYNEETALKVAEFLLKKKAVKLKPSEPFTWASGWKSPIYCDNRKTLSHPEVRTYIRQQFVKLIEDKIGTVDCIAGVATGGIAHGVLIAQDLGLPFIYVRSAPKGHGLGNLIEGDVPVGKTVLVVEDLVSTGGSSLTAVKALREAGCIVKHMVAVFDYDFQVKTDRFKEEKCELYSLSNYEFVIKKGLELDYVRAEDTDVLKSWRQAPHDWGK
ncbi:MAG: orotate phosphoribosyltransferase [Flavobacteriales bacterium]|nr:orotate phosphoribosyltransferase [Flavobacteriales bacterium]